MVLKEKIIELEDPISFNGEDVKELKIKEMSFAGQLRLQSIKDITLADIYGECVHPKGIMEVMNKAQSKKYSIRILEAYEEVNSIGEDKSPIEK